MGNIMDEYRKRNGGTDFDEADAALKTARQWRDIAQAAQTERDELRAALTGAQNLIAAQQAQLEAAQAENAKLRGALKSAKDVMYYQEAPSDALISVYERLTAILNS